VEAPITSEADLTREYGRLVQSIATRLKREMRLRVDLDDLVQVGMIGLIESWRRYESDHGVPFRAWAYYRVKGAMIDALPGMTGCSRAQLRILRRLRSADALAESLDDRFDGQTDAASDASYLAQAVAGVLLIDDMTELTEHADDSEASPNEPRSEFRANPEQIARRNQMRQLLHDCIDALEPDEAHLMREHYYNDRPLSDVALDMGVSRSWASRMHTRAVERIRLRLQQVGVYR
jgi:RNA polymerase sigma factor for flagellar operon FliA